MHESPNHWSPRLTATSPVATRNVRFTSIRAARCAQKAAIPRCCNRSTCAFSGNYSTSSGETDV
jgi:hypothetical protein